MSNCCWRQQKVKPFFIYFTVCIFERKENKNAKPCSLEYCSKVGLYRILIGVNHSYRCSRIVCITSITTKAHFIWFVFSKIFITVGTFIFNVAWKITKQCMCGYTTFRWMKYGVYTRKKKTNFSIETFIKIDMDLFCQYFWHMVVVRACFCLLCIYASMLLTMLIWLF